VKFSDPKDAPMQLQCGVLRHAQRHRHAAGGQMLLEAGVRVIDLAADFRIKDIAEWEKWYGMTHASPALVAEAVYGLPEVNREQIRGARLVANPGCYPTATQLGFLPLIEAGCVELESSDRRCQVWVFRALGARQKSASCFPRRGTTSRPTACRAIAILPEIRQGLAGGGSSRSD
jgi:N-acetyl-gamma-glutamyl-phosphate reductase